jgi:hypothetical protein
MEPVAAFVSIVSLLRIFKQERGDQKKADHQAFMELATTPVSYCAPGRPKSIYPPGRADQDIEITFPRSRTTCAVGGWITATRIYDPTTVETVKIANVRTAMAARRYLYGPKNDPNFFVPRPSNAA